MALLHTTILVSFWSTLMAVWWTFKIQCPKGLERGWDLAWSPKIQKIQNIKSKKRESWRREGLERGWDLAWSPVRRDRPDHHQLMTCQEN